MTQSVNRRRSDKNSACTVAEHTLDIDATLDIDIKHHMMSGTFYALNPGYKVYCVPTMELLNMLKEKAS